MIITDKIWAYMGYRIRGIRPRYFGSFSEVVGCNRRDLYWHLRDQFKPGMGEKNLGRGMLKWEIGPINQFDLGTEEGQLKAFHHTNLKPVWWRKTKGPNTFGLKAEFQKAQYP
jgi:hypothetical protein